MLTNRNIRIGKRLGVAFATIVLLMVINSLIGVVQVYRTGDLTHQLYNHPLTVSKQSRDLHIKVLSIQRAIKDILLIVSYDGDTTVLRNHLTTIERLDSEVDTMWDILYERYLGEKSDIDEVKQTFYAWKKVRNEVVNLSLGDGKETAVEMCQKNCNPMVEEVITHISHISDFATDKATTFNENSYATVWFTIAVTVLISILTIILTSIIALRITRSITTPLANLTYHAGKISKLDLREKIEEIHQEDELGELASAFQVMQITLKEHTQQVNESASNLAASISEISATASQFAASASETSATTAEVGTTVEEVRHTAQLVSEKTDRMSEASRRVNTISQQGKQDAQNSIAGIRTIDEEMAFIADSIIQLSEQTQNIGEIIEAVNDLTDQSNMLAVNASIEASKAGEFGKGFAVVAQEVKSLALQSKESTGQIKSILSDIQKATSSAVMATERGSKAVKRGVTLGDNAGTTINTLEQNISDTSMAAEQIGASSKQQLTGMEQLVVAVGNITRATEQNISGARQLEAATKDLKQLTQALQGIGARFKL